MKIFLSADSTCDVSPTIKEKYNISTISNHITINDEEYTDGVDITPRDVFDIYKEKKILCKTSAINVAEYMDYFSKNLKEYDSIIHFCLGDSLSSSYQNCLLASKEFNNVYVINSKNLSSTIAIMLMDCRDLIDSNIDINSIIKYFEDNIHKYYGSYILNNLDFIKASGRCSSAKAIGANILNIKPEITMNKQNGKMELKKKYRGSMKKVIISYIEDKMKRINTIQDKRIVITHAMADEEVVNTAYDKIKSYNIFKEIYIVEASCTMSVHCGSEAIGISYFDKELI